MRKKCLLAPEIITKLKQMLNLIHLQRDLNQLDPDLIDLNGGINIDLEKSLKIYFSKKIDKYKLVPF